MFSQVGIWIVQLLQYTYSYRIFGVQGYELRVNQLNDEIATLRKKLNERENQISNLRIETLNSTTRVIDFKARRRRIQWFFWSLGCHFMVLECSCEGLANLRGPKTLKRLENTQGC